MYTLKLPAKRIFSHGQGVAFVEERRTQLNDYLSQIVADPTLYGGPCSPPATRSQQEG